MKGTRNKLTSESRKSGGSPGKMLHCNMDRVPGGEKASACRYCAVGLGVGRHDSRAGQQTGQGQGSAAGLHGRLGRSWILTLVAQVGVRHELVNHQVHLPQLPRTEVLPASFVLQEDWVGGQAL